jgi:hypothetical protein
MSIEYHEKKIKKRASILKNETLIEMSIMFFEKATLCEGKFVHYKVLTNEGRTPYNQTLHNSNPFSSSPNLACSSCQKRKCAPSLGTPINIRIVQFGQETKNAWPSQFNKLFWLESFASKHMDHF